MAQSNETPNLIAQQNSAVATDITESGYWLFWKPSGVGTLQDGLLKVLGSVVKGTMASPAAIDVYNPTNAEKHMFYRTTVALTVTRLFAVLQGSSSPSVTYSVRYGSDLSGSGTEIVSGGSTVTSTTTGTSVTSFTNTVIPADSLIWMTTSAQSGTVTELHITVTF